ncbi:hypothetical protein [Helicobacter pylori]|uniref:hypothetical protein n=1 Tax=Helicobacter pylori TaxID=210 RepID=UPI0027388588|nr:hypothetical protein [Helicobacter pylori]
MGNLASGHFKPTNKIQAEHNDRTLSPNYLIPEEFRGQNEVNRPSTQARGLKDKIIENAINIYENTKKKNAPKFKAKSYQWSLVVNIKTNTTMSDLEKLAEHFEIKYGFQCYQIAIHRDEGHMDENNQPHINHHAHMEFITLDKNTGKNRQRDMRTNQLRQIQTEIAQILGMKRGTDKRVSGTERIEPRKYAQMKNKERKERLKDAELIDRLIRNISEFGTNNKMLNQKIKAKNQKIDELQERPTTEQYSQLEQANSEQAQTIKDKDKEIATLNTINAKLEKTNKDLQRPSMWDTIKESITTLTDKATGNTKRKIEELERKVANKEYSLDFYRNELQKEQRERRALEKEIATALDTANDGFRGKETILQEAVKRNHIVVEMLSAIYYFLEQTCPDYVSKIAEKHKHEEIFTKLWNAIKLLYNIIEKLFGDKNAKKDHQDIINAISELQERPTKQQLETLKQEKDNLKYKIQEKDKTIYELNQFKNSSNLALDLEKAQNRIKTLESNKTTIKNDLNAKESIIQAKDKELNTLKQEKTNLMNKLQDKDKTINELNKELKELEDNYRLERERMVAENKRLKEQGLEKTYIQKDYEQLKEQHEKEIEALKKEIQKYKTQETYTPTKRM